MPFPPGYLTVLHNSKIVERLILRGTITDLCQEYMYTIYVGTNNYIAFRLNSLHF